MLFAKGSTQAIKHNYHLAALTLLYQSLALQVLSLYLYEQPIPLILRPFKTTWLFYLGRNPRLLDQPPIFLAHGMHIRESAPGVPSVTLLHATRSRSHLSRNNRAYCRAVIGECISEISIHHSPENSEHYRYKIPDVIVRSLNISDMSRFTMHYTNAGHDSPSFPTSHKL